MRELPDSPLPTPDCRPEHRDGLHGWMMDIAGLGALALFVTAAQLWCGGLAG